MSTDALQRAGTDVWVISQDVSVAPRRRTPVEQAAGWLRAASVLPLTSGGSGCLTDFALNTQKVVRTDALSSTLR